MQAGWLSRVVIVLAALALILGLSSQAKAQVAGARISGTISDSTGAVVPNSSISIKDVDTGVSHDVTADGQGFYSIPNIPPGNYTMEIRAEGFSTQARAGLVLTVGQEQQLNFTMQVGQVNQVVQVTGAAPVVDVTSSEISAVVEQAAIVELPLNGRSWTDLTVLQRGVSYIETGSSPYSGPSRGCIRGCGAQLSIAGGRPQQNLYRMDGFSINDQYNASPGSGAHGLNLGVDAIKEFSVVTQPTAEYGNVSGGVVNAVTKSGTNSFHGGAYEFLRNSALDARNPVDPAVIPPFRRNQFGADGGFPIRKDKTFAFFDYEGLRESLTNTVLDKVPSANAHMGILSTGNVTVNANIVPALPLWPTPNDGLITPDQGLWAFGSRTQTDENYYITRIDHHFSAKDTISGTYMGDIAHQTMPDAFDLELIGVRTDRQIGTIEWTHILSPAMVNVVRVGGFHNASSNGIPAGVINPLAANTALATVPGIGGMGSVAISGGYTGNPGGVGSTLFRIDNWNTYQVYDDAFLTKGLHSIKFGYMFVRNQSNATNSTSPGGAWTFPSLSAFLQDQPSALTAQFPNFLSPRHERVSIHGVYIQDEWRFRPNLTINMGLRYEMSTVPTETDGKNADIDNITDGLSMVRVGAPLWINPTRENFEPRLGFAWDPRGNGKSSVRASFGIYDVLPLTYEIGSHITQAYPFFELGTSTSAAQLKGTFPTTGFAVLQNLNTAAFQQIFFQHNPKRNYVMQWNLDLQHQLTPNLTVALGYVGSHTNHNVFNDREADQVIPTLTSAGWLYPNPIGSGTKVNPAWGSIKAEWWESEASYNGLIASVTKRLSRSFQVQGSFTWSKSLDDSSSSQEGNGFANSLGNEDWWAGTLRSESYGPSDFNIGRTLIINAIWNIPGLHSSFKPATWATTGWEMGGIFRANDGPPFSATYGTGADPAGTLSSLSLGYPDVLTGTPGCGTLTNPGNPKNYVKTQCFSLPTAPNMSYWTANCSPSKGYPICLNLRGDAGRNIMNGPGLVSLDFSMVKNNNIKKISENFNLQFRAEVFNSLNHANWDPPTTTDVLTGTGTATGIGTLTATATNSRQIQFGLKMAW